MRKGSICFYLIQNGTPTIESPIIAPIATNNPVSRPTNNIKENSKRQATPTPFSQLADVHDGVQTNRQNTPGLNSPIDITQFNYDDHWQEIEVELDRVKKSEKKKIFYLHFILGTWCRSWIFNCWWN